MKSCIENIKIGDWVGFGIVGIENGEYVFSLDIDDDYYQEFEVIDKNNDFFTVGSNEECKIFSTSGNIGYNCLFYYDITYNPKHYKCVLKIIKSKPISTERQ